MKTIIFKEIIEEIDKLRNEDYRKSEKIWANEKQIKVLSKLLKKANSLNREDIINYCRFVSDIASLSSKISKLSTKAMGSGLDIRH
jgi:hypothetical protein